MKTLKDYIAEFYSDYMYGVDHVGCVDEMGFYALTYIGDEAEQRETMKDMGMDPHYLEEEFFEEGWYITVSDDQGFINWSRYENEDEARMFWSHVLEDYDKYYEDHADEEGY